MRARWEALQRFFTQPPPRSFDGAPVEVVKFRREFVGSARTSWFIVAGIVLVPYLVFAVTQVIALSRGRAFAGEVFGQVLGVGLALALCLLLPLWLFFRKMQRRDEARLLGLALGEARWFVPERVEAITRRGGEGRATVAWEVWLRVSDFHGRPMLRLLLPRGEDEPEPDRVFVVESPHGDCMAMWEPGAIFELIAAAKRRPLPRERHR